MRIEMKRFLTSGRASVRAFTMIEIAISIAVIAVGLIAIAGVLPAGLNVQRDNREDTIIQEDGAYLLEAITSGAFGAHQISNHVLSVTISENLTGGQQTHTRERYLPTDQWTPERILGLLSYPKMWPVGHRLHVVGRTNTVRALVKAFTGSSIEQSGDQDEFAFRYLATVETSPYKSVYTYVPSSGTPLSSVLTNSFDGQNEFNRNLHLQNNLWEVRVRIQWPIRGFAGGNVQVGKNEQVFSKVVAGKLEGPTRIGVPLYQLKPGTFRVSDGVSDRP